MRSRWPGLAVITARTWIIGFSRVDGDDRAAAAGAKILTVGRPGRSPTPTGGLLVHDPATQHVRNLFVVHDELGKGGWRGVEALPLSLVGRALVEASLLGLQEPSPVMVTIVETLRSIKVAAEARAAQALQDA